MAKTNIELTNLETRVLEVLKQNAQTCSGGDFACLEEVHVEGLSRKALGGVVTSLENKRVISVDITYVNQTFRSKGNKVTQVQFNLDIVGPGYGGFTIDKQ